MKKWEYDVIICTAESPLINSLGASGWEAYAVVSHSVNHAEGYIPNQHLCTFFFKRELIDSKQVIL